MTGRCRRWLKSTVPSGWPSRQEPPRRPAGVASGSGYFRAYFVQTPQEVWILWQRDHLVRRIYLNREHSLNPTPSWFGESVGHYENGELIIDTIGFIEHPYSFVDNRRTPHTKDLHTVERWRLVDGGTAIEATVTVDDPGAFNAPWSGLVRWTKFNRPLIESTCAENNENYGKLLGLREYPMPEAKIADF